MSAGKRDKPGETGAIFTAARRIRASKRWQQLRRRFRRTP